MRTRSSSDEDAGESASGHVHAYADAQHYDALCACSS